MLEKDDAGNRVGPHQIGNQIFRAGQVIDSDAPLDKIFRNKFERVHDGTPASKPEIIATIRTTNPAPVTKTVFEQTAKQTTETVVEDEEVEESTTSTSDSEPSKSKHGVDVTDDFADAELAGMKVYEKNGSFTVTDVESGEVMKKAKSDKLITKFLKKHLS